MRIPSKSQQQAIDHLSGPAMVIAGPGSGKTFTIVQRILSLIDYHHIPAQNILVITYTRAAAAEMKERFEKARAARAKEPEPGSVNFGTFHSICYHILKQSGKIKENSLIKEIDQRKLIQVILKNMGLGSRSGYDAITELLHAISKGKNFACPHKTEAEGDANGLGLTGFSEEELQRVQREYDRYLREQGLVDFDDMILLCLKLFSTQENSFGESVLDRYRKLFCYILADEFQDINPPQYEILKLLAHPLDNLFVVGDDDQAIYGFRGATPGIMQQFSADFREARRIMLTENYRCGADIVKLAEELISQNRERFAKEFYPVRPKGRVIFTCFDSHREEEMGIAEVLSGLAPGELSDTAVIVRTNREAALYAGYLKENKIAVKKSRVRKEDPYHGFIMEDVMSFLGFLYEGSKRGDFICFMNKPNRFITRTALPDERVSLRALEQYYEKNPEMLGKLRSLFRQLKIAETLTPYLAVSFFRKSLGYNAYLRGRAKEEGEFQRLSSLADQVQECFRDYKKEAPVRDFVEQKARAEGGGAAKTGQETGVNILTMHGAKGLEFDRVFLPDLNEGVIPGRNCLSAKDLEEERRLLYVAVTRARKELYLYCSRERGRKPSRYLEGLTVKEPDSGHHLPCAYSSSSTSSSNSTPSRYSSKASETISYSSSSSI